MITSRNSAVTKSRPQKSQRDAHQQQGEDEDDDDTHRTIWSGVPRRTKFESNSGHKAVYDCAMPYLMALMMAGPKFSEDPENEQISPWPERNSMALDRTMVEVWNKWAIELGRREGRRDRDVADRPTKYEARKVSTRTCIWMREVRVKIQTDTG